MMRKLTSTVDVTGKTIKNLCSPCKRLKRGVSYKEKLKEKHRGESLKGLYFTSKQTKK